VAAENPKHKFECKIIAVYLETIFLLCDKWQQVLECAIVKTLDTLNKLFTNLKVNFKQKFEICEADHYL